jgi:hypothetical protein
MVRLGCWNDRAGSNELIARRQRLGIGTYWTLT